MTTSRIFLLLTVVSLTVRLALLVAVTPDLTPLYDEGEYLKRGRAFSTILEQLADLEAPSRRARNRAYGNGVWPPAHPLLLGVTRSLFGDSVVVARLVVTIISSITTGLVFLLTLRIAGRPAAVPAAVVHMLHPSLLAFSHLLWSETTFIFFLLLTVLALVGAKDASSTRRTILWTLLAGLSLGLACLTRAVALLLLFVVPAWVVASGRGSRAAWGRAGLILVAVGFVVSPWQWAIQKHEGEFLPLSTDASSNLVMGNSPWEAARASGLKRRIQERAREVDTTTANAARTIAFEEIRSDLRGFADRCLGRFRALWGLDTIILRHTLMAIYPPLSGIGVWFVLAVLIAAVLVTTGLVGAGIAAGPLKSPQFLLLLMAGAVALPPIVTISSSRMGLPVLALLLPFAGVGAVALPRLATRHLLAVGGLAVTAVVSAVTLPGPEGLVWPGSSSYYSETIGQLDRLLGTHTPLVDCLQVSVDERTELTLAQGFRFVRDAAQTRIMEPSKGSTGLDIVSLEAESSNDPREVKLLVQTGASAAAVTPIRREYWRQWERTPVEGLSVRWCGGQIRARRLPNRPVPQPGE